MCCKRAATVFKIKKKHIKLNAPFNFVFVYEIIALKK